MRIGPYDILLELGRGGMGAVYLARLSGAGDFERLVAVKRALPHSLADGDTRDRFLHEARLAASVHHANVVGIHQVGSDAVGPYLACDFVEGESLAGLIDRSKKHDKLPMRVVLRIVIDALAGLSAVHEAADSRGRKLGILHRDVSVENLLVGLDGVTRITDFGIAKSTHSPVKTTTGTIHGKLLYLAPEYLEGEPADRSCDLYAMGITLFAALTSTYPFPIDDVSVLIEHIHTSPLPSLTSRGVEAPAALEEVLRTACHRERARRYREARAMLDALEEAAEACGGVARQQEVADFVESVAGEALRARRGMLSERSEFPRPLAPKAEANGALGGVTTRSPVPPSRTAKLDLRFVGAALGALGAGVAAFVYLNDGTPPPKTALKPSAPAVLAPQALDVPAAPVLRAEGGADGGAEADAASVRGGPAEALAPREGAQRAPGRAGRQRATRPGERAVSAPVPTPAVLPGGLRPLEDGLPKPGPVNPAIATDNPYR